MVDHLSTSLPECGPTEYTRIPNLVFVTFIHPFFSPVSQVRQFTSMDLASRSLVFRNSRRNVTRDAVTLAVTNGLGKGEHGTLAIKVGDRIFIL